jgi:DNA transposition AAA+ family ATPase
VNGLRRSTCWWVRICIDQHVRTAPNPPGSAPDYVELIIIDESERLSDNAIEHLRDQYDRGDHGLLLIGMPGIQKTFSRHPQLYSRVGFAHHYRPLTGEELTFVLTRHRHKLGLDLDHDDFTDAQAVAALARITGGNFRLLQRMFTGIGRIMKINELTVITADVIETARSTLVIGAT